MNPKNKTEERKDDAHLNVQNTSKVKHPSPQFKEIKTTKTKIGSYFIEEDLFNFWNNEQDEEWNNV